ncbi:MAG: hypothetical protein H0U53_08745 [Actinobacteria bacterium]|nr:hypothetical protein [Actinomycetota bacterium]
MKRTTSWAAILLGSILLSAGCGSQDATTTPGAAATSAEEVGGAGSPEDGGSTGLAYSEKYNFEATTFDGAPFELAAHKGTPVVINFWESW